MLLTGVPVDPVRDEARRWLEQELRDPDYQLRESLTVRVWRWITSHLPSLDLPGQLPAWTAWAVLAAVLLIALAVLAFAARDRWRRGTLAAAGTAGAVLDEVGTTAAGYRRRARDAARAGHHGTAVLDAYRAVAAGAVERSLLDRRPGRTAHEVALGLAGVFPDEAAALAAAADRFDAVRYGGAPATAAEAAATIELDRRVAAARPLLAAAGAPGAAR